MILPIAIWPSDKLTQECLKVITVSEETDTLCEHLEETMLFYGGIGIAAPQVGIPLQVFLISTEIDESSPVGTLSRAFINPEIVEVSEELISNIEGCLSFPEIFIKISRPAWCVIKATGRDGKEFTFDTREVKGLPGSSEDGGLLSRAILHEFDHITGKTMIDFVGNLRRNMVRKKLKKRKNKLK